MTESPELHDHVGGRGPADESGNKRAVVGDLTRWQGWSPSRRRLHGEVVAFSHEVQARAESTISTEPAWLREVLDLLRIAAERAASGSVSAGFEALNASRRVAVAGYSPAELAAEATALKEEAGSGKLPKWRCAAIEAVLKQLKAQSKSTDKEALLQVALRIRDDGAQNVHRKHAIVASRYWQLVSVVIGAVSLLILLSWRRPLDLSASAAEMTGVFIPGGWAMGLYAFLLGTIGASMSAGLSLSKMNADDRVPQVRASTIPAVFRPAFGGAAAIGASAILSAGLLADLAVSGGTVAAFSFLAGFSERLIDTVAGRFHSPG